MARYASAMQLKVNRNTIIAGEVETLNLCVLGRVNCADWPVKRNDCSFCLQASAVFSKCRPLLALRGIIPNNEAIKSNRASKQ